MELSAQKHDQEKVRLELIPTAPVLAIGEVLTFGAKKYAAHNWRGGFKTSRLMGAALRHIMAYNDGEDKDPESGLSHLAHAGCCIMFALEQEIKGTGEDDRYKPLRREVPEESPPTEPYGERLAVFQIPAADSAQQEEE